jgi:hypothetical protein
VFIIGRRHHVLHPEELIAAYKSAAGKVRTIKGFAGFEIYVPDSGKENGVLPAPERIPPGEGATNRQAP